MILYDNQYEQLAIGMMITNELATFKGVSELIDECFFDPNYRIVFAALSNLVNKQKKINIYNVNTELISIGQVLSLDDLISIEDKFYIPEKFDTIIDTLLDRAKKRKALNQIKVIEQELETSTTDYETIIKPIGDLYNIHQDSSQEIITGKNYIEVRERHDEHKRTRIPLYTGYQEIDESLTYKLSTGEISVIAARPSNGKSAFKTNLIRNMCRRKIGVVSYALEQTTEVETDRMESIESGISLMEIANLNFWEKADPRWEKLLKARNEIASWNYILLKGFNKSFFEMQSELRFLKSQGIKVVLWDLFDRMKDISSSIANKAQNVTRIMNLFLGLADELDMHFCFLVQLNRKSVDKSGKKTSNTEDRMPKLHELKDSGGYEEVSRVVFILNYPKHYDTSLATSTLRVKLAKQSNGPTPEFKFNMSEETLKITESGSEGRGLTKPSSPNSSLGDLKPANDA